MACGKKNQPGKPCCSPCGSCNPCINSISLDTCKSLLWSWPLKDYTACGRLDYKSDAYLPLQVHKGCYHEFYYCESGPTTDETVTYHWECIDRGAGNLVKIETDFTNQRRIERKYTYVVAVNYFNGKLTLTAFFREEILPSDVLDIVVKTYRRTNLISPWVLQTTTNFNRGRRYWWYIGGSLLSGNATRKDPLSPLSGFDGCPIQGTVYIGQTHKYYQLEIPSWDCVCKTFHLPRIPYITEPPPTAFTFGNIPVESYTWQIGTYFLSEDCPLPNTNWVIPYTTLCASSSVDVTLSCRSAESGGGA